MTDYTSISTELKQAVAELENWLLNLPTQVISNRRNTQNRTIKQIVGHMIDSASNNTHRVIHLQYQQSPIIFPDYANNGNNDRWIAIQNFQDEDWQQLVQIWKYDHLHYCHVIQQIDPDKNKQAWISGTGEKITLEEMVKDFPRHFELHISEIKELAES